MTPLRKLSLKDHAWLRNPALEKLLALLNADGTNARLVGGCVRDALQGREISDIDVACSLAPEESLRRLEAAGVKVVPTGLKHGTITAILDGSHFEITALRHDVETDGRHARVAYIDDWVQDARRRDFTFNALYLDGDGTLYDPFGGYDDLMARRVRFIGEAAARIREDALRILRFFRFAAQVGEERLDRQGLDACVRLRHLIDGLSGERLAQEMFKILKTEFVTPVMQVMSAEGILDRILPGNRGLEVFTPFVRLERELDRCDGLARLASLLPVEKAAVAKASRHLRLSNQLTAILVNYATAPSALSLDISEREARKYIYLWGRPVFTYAYLLTWALSGRDGQDKACATLLAYAEQWTIPTFPVLGRDLKDCGMDAGPEMGRLLKNLENKWIENDFSLTREALLRYAEKL